VDYRAVQIIFIHMLKLGILSVEFHNMLNILIENTAKRMFHQERLFI